jgi:hypothetical protein
MRARRAAACGAVALAIFAAACDRGAPTTPPPGGGQPVPRARLLLQMAGLPLSAGLPADRAALSAAGFGLRVRGPAALDTTFVGDGALESLAPGRYVVTVSRADFEDVAYVPDADSLDVVLESGQTRVVATQYAPTTGGLDLRASGGVPDTAAMPALLQHADGRVDTLSLPTRRVRLRPGPFVLTPLPRDVDGVRFEPQRSPDTLIVRAGPITQPTAVPYTSRLATLRLRVDGVAPGDGPARVTLRASTGGLRTVLVSDDSLDIADLLGGTYEITAGPFAAPLAQYSPERDVDTVRVAAGVLTIADVPYRRETASIALEIEGLPEGAVGDVQVAGPFNFLRAVSQTTVLTPLRTGAYTIVANPVSARAHTWRADLATQVVNAEFGSPVQRTVQYGLATGALAVRVLGLPDGVSANVSVQAPSGTTGTSFPWTLTRDTTGTNVPAGTYTITANAVFVGGTLYLPSPAQRTVTVLPSLTPIDVPITYVETVGPILDFAIRSAYLTQATQRPDGSVPLVASRAAFMRVFVDANQGNSESLTARVRLYQGAALYRTLLIPSPSSSVPLGVNEGLLAQSWNVPIDAGDVREGMSFVVDFGDTPGVSDANPANNRFPIAGQQPVDVRAVPPFTLVLVPVAHPIDGVTGNITAANATAFTAFSRGVLPLEQVSVTVRAPFTTAAAALLPDDANNAWFTLLNEIRLLQLADGNSASHYVGIVGTTYSTGIAGLASIGGRYALSWDNAASGPRVLAHELGHTFGRFHSPGCGAGFIDANYPYGGGAIGQWGWTGSALASPTATNDIMGYCSLQWTSDYTWRGILTQRAATGSIAALRRAAPARDSMLLVWGHIGPNGAHLEPALPYITAPDLPAVGSGRYTLEWLDAESRVLHQLRFDGDPVDHKPQVRTFAAAVPRRAWRGTVVALRLREGPRTLATLRAGDGALTLVQDEATGAPLGLLRGAARPWATGSARAVLLHRSDGLRVRTTRGSMR